MVTPISTVTAVQAAMRTLDASAGVAAGGSAGSPGFGDMLRSVASNAVGAVSESERLSVSAMRGEASLQDVVRAAVSAELTLETAVGVRNKLIESYQEIMRMPI